MRGEYRWRAAWCDRLGRTPFPPAPRASGSLHRQPLHSGGINRKARASHHQRALFPRLTPASFVEYFLYHCREDIRSGHPAAVPAHAGSATDARRRERARLHHGLLRGFASGGALRLHRRSCRAGPGHSRRAGARQWQGRPAATRLPAGDEPERGESTPRACRSQSARHPGCPIFQATSGAFDRALLRFSDMRQRP